MTGAGELLEGMRFTTEINYWQSKHLKLSILFSASASIHVMHHASIHAFHLDTDECRAEAEEVACRNPDGSFNGRSNPEDFKVNDFRREPR